MASIMDRLTGRGGRAAAGGALVADGLVGIDVPFGRRRAGILGALLMLVIGCVFVGVGVWWHGQHQPYANGVSTSGTVTGVQTSRNNKNRLQYSRVFAFKTSDGRSVTATEPEASSSRPTVGTSVEVSYLQADPGSARIIPAHDWAPYGVMAMGGLAALAGLCSFVIRLVSLIVGIRLLRGAMRERRAEQNMGRPG